MASLVVGGADDVDGAVADGPGDHGQAEGEVAVEGVLQGAGVGAVAELVHGLQDPLTP